MHFLDVRLEAAVLVVDRMETTIPISWHYELSKIDRQTFSSPLNWKLSIVKEEKLTDIFVRISEVFETWNSLDRKITKIDSISQAVDINKKATLKIGTRKCTIMLIINIS